MKFGIPHAMMSDGTPTDTDFAHNKNDWKFDEAGRMDAGFQMQIDAPDFVETDAAMNQSYSKFIFRTPQAVVK